MTGCAVDPVLDTDDKADESSSVGTNIADPSQTFNTQVKPNVTTCVACHGGSLAPTLTSYVALEGKFKAKPGATNPLVTKGVHAGPSLTASQRTAIVNWIDSLPSPSQTHDSQVKPIVSAMCLACHGGTVAPNLTSYATLEGRYKAKPGATNPLVAKGIHEGPALTATQASTIANWIDTLP
jgi:cytochrome c553